MSTSEKEIESCGKMVTIPIIVMVIIILITGIIELSKQNDNLFLLIIFIITTVFTTFCVCLHIFSNYLNRQNISEKEEHTVIEI